MQLKNPHFDGFIEPNKRFQNSLHFFLFLPGCEPLFLKASAKGNWSTVIIIIIFYYGKGTVLGALGDTERNKTKAESSGASQMHKRKMSVLITLLR